MHVLVINTQACYFFNYALYQELNDAGNQLNWLEKELKEIEISNELAMIIGHVSPGDFNCIHRWSSRF